MFGSFDFLYYLCILKALPWSAAGVIPLIRERKVRAAEGVPLVKMQAIGDSR